MKEHYTYDALVQFLYREMPADSAAATARLIDEDLEAQALFSDLALAKMQLPKVQFHPSQSVINNILQYSTKTALEAQF